MTARFISAAHWRNVGDTSVTLVSQPRSVVFGGGVSPDPGILADCGIVGINFWRNARNPLHVHRTPFRTVSLPWETASTKSTVQLIAIGIEGLDCSKSSPYKLCTAPPIKLYHERVSRTGSVFPIFWGYKLIDKPVQNLYGLVLQSRPHSIPVAIDCKKTMMMTFK